MAVGATYSSVYLETLLLSLEDCFLLPKQRRIVYAIQQNGLLAVTSHSVWLSDRSSGI